MRGWLKELVISLHSKVVIQLKRSKEKGKVENLEKSHTSEDFQGFPQIQFKELTQMFKARINHKRLSWGLEKWKKLLYIHIYVYVYKYMYIYIASPGNIQFWDFGY